VSRPRLRHRVLACLLPLALTLSARFAIFVLIAFAASPPPAATPATDDFGCTQRCSWVAHPLCLLQRVGRSAITNLSRSHSALPKFLRTPTFRRFAASLHALLGRNFARPRKYLLTIPDGREKRRGKLGDSHLERGQNHAKPHRMIMIYVVS
jgi:hypothetical protein